ncbi:hypothetical protein BJ508DRAFT_330869 [Ascobolus immersus RN42]|uniref:Uncharacterized protein n=1 Tax=Ascobolus immersus RN42 TaxID=1160509 RepID=A0A3N4HXM0_ASCIM|nr:hypothetical protein BJ508DRAFT_330869 [Ascobolus immersus RN42]
MAPIKPLYVLLSTVFITLLITGIVIILSPFLRAADTITTHTITAPADHYMEGYPYPYISGLSPSARMYRARPIHQDNSRFTHVEFAFDTSVMSYTYFEHSGSQTINKYSVADSFIPASLARAIDIGPSDIEVPILRPLRRNDLQDVNGEVHWQAVFVAFIPRSKVASFWAAFRDRGSELYRSRDLAERTLMMNMDREMMEELRVNGRIANYPEDLKGKQGKIHTQTAGAGAGAHSLPSMGLRVGGPMVFMMMAVGLFMLRKRRGAKVGMEWEYELDKGPEVPPKDESESEPESEPEYTVRDSRRYVSVPAEEV